MEEELKKAFPSIIERELSPSYIEKHPNPIWDVPEISLLKAIPLYMLWCVENKGNEGALVFEGTISALNNYARARNSEIQWQNFKYQCTEKQIEVVILFLIWCRENLILDYEPELSRAIKNWQGVSGS